MKKYYVASLAVIVILAPQIAGATPLPGPFINHSDMTEYDIYNGIGHSYIEASYVYAAIVGFDKVKQDAAASSVQEIMSLRSENSTLRSQLSDLESRVRRLENAGPIVSSVSTPINTNTTIIEQADMTRVAAVEKRLNILEQYLYMVEQRIGELYARVNMLIAPVYKALGIK